MIDAPTFTVGEASIIIHEIKVGSNNKHKMMEQLNKFAEALENKKIKIQDQTLPKECTLSDPQVSQRTYFMKKNQTQSRTVLRCLQMSRISTATVFVVKREDVDDIVLAVIIDPPGS